MDQVPGPFRIEKEKSMSEREKLIDVAMGREKADKVIQGGNLVNVHSHEIYAADLAISGSRIAYVGSVQHTVGPLTEKIDASGKFLCPGFIDGHIHTYETCLPIDKFAEAAIPHGTTAIVTDFYGEAIVGGKRGVKECLAWAKEWPLRVLFVLPMSAYYQQRPFLHTGSIDANDMVEMLDWDECYGVNNIFADKLAEKDPFLLRILEETRKRGKIICGHASEMTGPPLQGWIAGAGPICDHESITAEEAVEKARLGVTISLREGSAVHNAGNLVAAITQRGVDPRCFEFCADALAGDDLVIKGHIDNNLRIAVGRGLDPITAVQIATLNSALHLHLDREIGSLTPGKSADIVVVKDLREFEISEVIIGGKHVVSGRKWVRAYPKGSYPEWVKKTVHLKGKVIPGDFIIRYDGVQDRVLCRVIGVSRESSITKEVRSTLPVKDKVVLNDVPADIVKIAVLDRHKATGAIGKGFIQGLGLRNGAVASTFVGMLEDMVVAGTNDRDMAAACNILAEKGGGFVVVQDERPVGFLELPLFGLLADCSLNEVLEKFKTLKGGISRIGSDFYQIFHRLAFVALPVTQGKIKICNKGVVDVWKGEIVDVVIQSG